MYRIMWSPKHNTRFKINHRQPPVQNDSSKLLTKSSLLLPSGIKPDGPVWSPEIVKGFTHISFAMWAMLDKFLQWFAFNPLYKHFSGPTTVGFASSSLHEFFNLACFQQLFHRKILHKSFRIHVSKTYSKTTITGSVFRFWR